MRLITAVGRAGPTGLSRRTLFVLAGTCGATVANVYNNQPLLPEIARTFHASAAATGWVATAAQGGYAVGLCLVVPLGDVRDRRRLILTLLAAVSVALTFAAISPTLPVLIGASALVGITTVIPQLVMPYAAGRAAPQQRARTVGIVMSGLLSGILLGRVVAGVIASYATWRLVYLQAAFVMVVLGCVLRTELSPTPTLRASRWWGPLATLPELLRTTPSLVGVAVTQALLFAGFSAFWTTIPFRLAEGPYHWGGRGTAAVALLGASGALAAPVAGRLSDRFGNRRIAVLAASMTLAGLVPLLFSGRASMLVAGVILLDAGVQTGHTANQSAALSLRPTAASRCNAVYMIIMFMGGAAGTAIGSWAWQHHGWSGVVITGLTTSTAALAVAVSRRPAVGSPEKVVECA